MKKGFSLVEIVIVIALVGFITCSIIIIFSKSNFLFKSEIKYNRENSYIKEAFMYLESEIGGADRSTYTSNEIYTYRLVKNKNELIERKNRIFINSSGTVMITYYENDLLKGQNNVIRDIKSFIINQDKNTVHLTLITGSGRKFERCVYIRN